MTRTSLLSLAVVALLGAALVAGCGGDSGGDEDPQQVLDETFSNDQTINSGVLDLSLSVSAEGDEGGSLDASLSGPFQGDEQQEGEFPQFDLTVDASGEGGGQEFDFEGGFLATSDAAFVSYQDETYEVPSAFFNQIKKTSERAQRQARQQGNGEDAGAVFEQLGIDPSGWLTNLENEGDEDVEGTETIQIHGDADVAAIVEDIQGAAEQAGGEAIDPDQTAEIEESVDEASIDVYSGKEDRILRRLDLNLALSPSEDATVDNVEIEFALTLSDVNEDQTIEAPSDAQPFSQLEQALGLPSGILEGALGGELGSGGGGLGESLGGGGGGGGGGAGGGGAGGNEIAECLQNATSEEEINDCLTQ